MIPAKRPAGPSHKPRNRAEATSGGAQVDISVNGRSSILHLTGELDAFSAPDVEGRITQALAERASSDVILDLSGLSFMDSTGVHLLIQISHKLPSGGKLIVSEATGSVRRVLELTQLDRMPNIEVR
jgi:anti-anti-sigma factor